MTGSMKRGEVWWVAFDPSVGSEIRKACNLKLVQFFRFDVPELYQQSGELAYSYYENGYYQDPQP